MWGSRSRRRTGRGLSLWIWKGALLLFLLLLISCLAPAGPPGQRLLVFAAASLTDVLQELGQEFTASSGIPLRFHFGGSVALAQQILRGAPADVFIAAGEAPLKVLEDRGQLKQGSSVPILTNELVVVGPAGGEVVVQALQDLVTPRVSRIAVGDPAVAPVGQYTREALKAQGLWDALKPKLLFGMDARTTLAYVESGDAEVGIVYRTDALISKKVRLLLTLPRELYPHIVYPAAVMNSSRNPEAAQAFVAFLKSQEARRTFEEYGFMPAGILFDGPR